MESQLLLTVAVPYACAGNVQGLTDIIEILIDGNLECFAKFGPLVTIPFLSFL